MSERASGWYPDPSGENRQRFWDGDDWTEYYQPLAPQHVELRGAETALEDYPYLSQSKTSTPEIPASAGWPDSTQAPSWQTSATTSWGTPATSGAEEYRSPVAEQPASQQPAGQQRTEVFAAGEPPRRSGAAIAVVAGLAVVLGLLVAGGFWLFRSPGGDAEPDVPTGDIEVGGQTSDTVSGSGVWTGQLGIQDEGVYLFDVRTEASSDADLTITVRAPNGGYLGGNEDRGRYLQGTSNASDPLLPLHLGPGEYEVTIDEQRNSDADFTLDLQVLDATVELGETLTAQLDTGDLWLAVLELDAETTVTIDVASQNDGDPTLTVFSTTSQEKWENDDRASGDFDPLLNAISLPAGSFVVAIAEYSGEPLEVEIDIRDEG